MLFSIILPTYNRANFLPKAIQSIQQQSYHNWELLIVDDGSTDKTKEVISQYLSDERIKYIYQTNQERSAARNKGINQAKGKYITFLDSDDYFLPERLELIKDSINKQNNPVTIFYTGICFQMNTIIEKRIERPFEYTNVFDFIIQAIIGVPQAIIHRKILQKHQFSPMFTIGEDMELWLRIVDEYPIQFLKNQETYIAVNHEDRSVNEKRYNSGRKQLELLHYIFSRKHPGNKSSKRIKQIRYSDTFFSIARHYLYNKKNAFAAKYLVFSLLKYPGHAQTKHKLFLIRQIILHKKTEYAQNAPYHPLS